MKFHCWEFDTKCSYFETGRQWQHSDRTRILTVQHEREFISTEEHKIDDVPTRSSYYSLFRRIHLSTSTIRGACLRLLQILCHLTWTHREFQGLHQWRIWFGARASKLENTRNSDNFISISSVIIVPHDTDVVTNRLINRISLSAERCEKVTGIQCYQ